MTSEMTSETTRTFESATLTSSPGTGSGMLSTSYSSSAASGISGSTSLNGTTTFTSQSSSSSVTPSSLSTSITSGDSSLSATSTANILSPTSLHTFARSLSTYLSIGAAVLGVFIAICLFFWIYRRRKRRNTYRSRFGDDHEYDEDVWNGSRRREPCAPNKKTADPETEVAVGIRKSSSEEPKEVGEKGEREDGVLAFNDRQTTTPTMRLITTPTSPQSSIDEDLKDDRNFYGTVDVASVRSASYASIPSPGSESGKMLLGGKR